MTATAFALAVAEDVPFTIVGKLAPWLTTVAESGADEVDP